LKLLFDQNLSYKLVRSFFDEFPGSAHVRDLGLASALDTEVWEYAKQFGFTIVSKDTDFSQRGFLFGPPPKVIWIRLGNCSTKEIQDVLFSYATEIRQFGLDPDSSFFPIDPIAGKNPTRVLVESSAISAILYDPKLQTLDIEFKSSGETYRYFDVPEDEYEGLMTATSKGAYLNSEIKSKYRTRKIL
jgi:predicted nuclease of predicted toxin-antitoxin system